MKHKALTTLAALLMAAPTFAADEQLIGVVNFGSCMTESKAGKKEQENLESIRKEIVSRAQETEKELQEIRVKFEDPEFLDGLSPKAEEELQAKKASLEQDLARFDQQYSQVMQYSQYQMAQKLIGDIAKAAEQVAADKNLSYVLSREACFYVRSDLDVTQNVIQAMDSNYELQAQKAENETPAAIESMEPKAG